MMMMMSLQPNPNYSTNHPNVMPLRAMARKASVEEAEQPEAVIEAKKKPIVEDQGDTFSLSTKKSAVDSDETEDVSEESPKVAKKKATDKTDKTTVVKATDKTKKTETAKKIDKKSKDDDEDAPPNFWKWAGIAVGSVVGTVTLFNTAKAGHWYFNQGKAPVSAEELRGLADRLGDPQVIGDLMNKFRHLEPSFAMGKDASVTDKLAHWWQQEFVLPSLMPKDNKNKIMKYIWLEGGVLDRIFGKEKYFKKLNDLTGNTFKTKDTQIDISSGDVLLTSLETVMSLAAKTKDQEVISSIVLNVLQGEFEKAQNSMRDAASNNFGDLDKKDFANFKPVIEEAVEISVNKLLKEEGKNPVDINSLSMDKEHFTGGGAVAVYYHVPGTAYGIKLVKPGINDETIPASLEHEILKQILKGKDYKTAVKDAFESFSSIAIETNLGEEFDNTAKWYQLPNSIVKKTKAHEHGITSLNSRYFVMNDIPQFSSLAAKDLTKNATAAKIEEAKVDIAMQSVLDKIHGVAQADPHGGNGGIGIDIDVARSQKATFAIDFGRTLALDPTVAKKKRALELALILGQEEDSSLLQKLRDLNLQAYQKLDDREQVQLLEALKEQPLDSSEQLFLYGFLNHDKNKGWTLPTIQREAELNVNNRMQAGMALAKTQCFVEDYHNILIKKENESTIAKFNENLKLIVEALTQDSQNLSVEDKGYVTSNLKAKLKDYFYIKDVNIYNSDDESWISEGTEPVFDKQVVGLVQVRGILRNLDSYLTGVFGVLKPTAETFFKGILNAGSVKQFHKDYYTQYAG